jgi:hypothetical protein
VVTFHFPDVVHAADARVGDLPRDLDFIKEALEPRRVIFDHRRQELQRHRLAELEVVGAVDLAHPPATEQADDPVAASQHRPREESAAVGGRRRAREIERSVGRGRGAVRAEAASVRNRA